MSLIVFRNTKDLRDGYIMAKKNFCKSLFLLLFIFCLNSITPVAAQWSNDPAVNTLVAAPADQLMSPATVSDGSGGAIIVYKSCGSGDDCRFYAQRLNASGTKVWSPSGVPVLTTPLTDMMFFDHTIISDGEGGVIITWSDSRDNPDVEIYAQRINAAGVVQWGADGVMVCGADYSQSNPVITSDGTGGAIIAWIDYREMTNSYIYAQRLNAGGAAQWTTDGVRICNNVANENNPAIASDAAGGAIITFYDDRDHPVYGQGTGIYAQRINGSGSIQWGTNAVEVCNEIDYQIDPSIIQDGSGGAIIAWDDQRSGVIKIYTQKINATGGVVWATGGIAVAPSVTTQEYKGAKLTTDGSGGAIITWTDVRNNTDFNIYAQRVTVAGTLQWGTGGAAICLATDGQQMQAIAADGSGGAVITWADLRISGLEPNIYAQRINASGLGQWTANGVVVCSATGAQIDPSIINNGSGKMIIVWVDQRTNLGASDIYAQMVNADGTLASSCAGNWIGGTSTDWFNPANWCGGAVPDANTNVVIPAGTSFSPVINANVTVKSLTINSGAALTVNAPYTLTVLHP